MSSYAQAAMVRYVTYRNEVEEDLEDDEDERKVDPTEHVDEREEYQLYRKPNYKQGGHH